MQTLDRLPEGEPLGILRELETVSKESKAFQSVGDFNVVTSRIFSGADYDVSIPANDGRDILVEFIPSDLTFGGALCYQLVAVNVPLVGLPSIATVERLRVGSDNRQRWMLYNELGTSHSDPLNYKFYFFTAGSGTFTANLV